MRHALLILSCTLLAACDRPTATPAPQAATPSSASTSPAAPNQAPDAETTPHKDTAVTSGPTADAAKTPDTPGKLVLSDQEWKERLTPQEYYVLRQKGTERPFTGKYDEFFQPGTYACAACGAELFESDTKFDAGCGWPAFYAAKAGDHVKLTKDISLGMIRTEVTCARCGSHLGHVFDDAPQTPTGERFCINSVSLKFIPKDKKNDKDKGGAKDKP
jgi:peptide-methionine (R)-S-oxide reductase